MLNEMLQTVLGLDADIWDTYAFRSDPYRNKLSPARRKELSIQARSAANHLAQSKRKKYAGQTVSQVLAHHAVSVQDLPDSTLGTKTTFAFFEEPDKIFVNHRAAAASEQQLNESGCGGFLEGNTLLDILLTHELYHCLESRDPALYSHQKHLTIWRLGPFHWDATIPALSEIGAMAFAKEYLGLSFSPFLLDVLLLYACNRQHAHILYDSILRL
jgi:hypothetical protein